MSRTTFTELIKSCEIDTDRNVQATITEDWMQGRTTYGGLSAALCLRAAELSQQNSVSSLPPLRSAMINFVGPAGGAVSMQADTLRAGKSVSNIQVNMSGEHGLATHAVFTFGASRPSKLSHYFKPCPTVPKVDESDGFFNHSKRPSFTQNFEVKLAKGAHPLSGSDEHEHYLWIRHKDKKANDLAALIGIADMPPPAVLPMFEEFSPISSMTWMINFLSEDLSTEDGWWLMRTTADHAIDGYSSQDMQIWNSRGDLVTTGHQSVAIFY